MKTIQLALVTSLAALPLGAETNRHADAHEHGVSTLELAIEHHRIEMNLTSPGADIVGFEYKAESDADKDAVEAAIRLMLVPENVVTLPDAAECRLAEVLAHLHGHDAHEDEDHDHGDEEHEDHAEEHDAEHSEFHVRYIFDCAHPEDLTAIRFPFFATFANAKEIEAQFVTETGAGAAEVERDAPELSLN